MADKILFVILIAPLYAIFIWTYFYPREGLLWGRRWMYNEEPEFTEGAIRYTKISSAVGVVVLTIIMTVMLFR